MVIFQECRWGTQETADTRQHQMQSTAGSLKLAAKSR